MKNLLLIVCAMLLTVSIIQAQETEVKKDENLKQEKLYFKVKGNGVKGNAKPDIYVDGKKFDFAIELLNQDKIESVSVIKDERAIKEYNAPNGVVLIKTKKKMDSDKTKIIVTGYATGSEKTDSGISKVIIRGNSNLNGKIPVIIIDGKVSGKESLEKLTPDEIDNIEIVKGEKAIKKYNAPNGAVIITTNKGKKK